MMKSFFKKLAFVMALAMVVSTAAPAASVFAADAQGLALQTATSDAEIVTSYNIAVGGEPTDFKFYGCANWKTRGLVWTSSNEAVATVDQTGKVLGITDGVATINLKSADGAYDVSVEIVVGKGDMAYVYQQTSHNTAAFIFKQDVEFKKSDVTLIRVYSNGLEVPCKVASVSCEKNVVAVASSLNFEDGDVYIIKFGADDQGTKFETKIGAPDEIKVSYESMGQAGFAYAKLNEDDDDIPVTLKAKLYYQGIDVTALYKDAEIEYELLNESDEIELIDDTLVFEKHNLVAKVVATYEYELNDEDQVAKSEETEILSIHAPEYELLVTDWTLASLKTDKLSIDWSKDTAHSIKDGDENEHQIVLFLKDSYGNLAVYPDDFAQYSKLGDTKKEILTFTELKSEVKAANNYEIGFECKTETKLFVGTVGGEITPISDGTASVLVTLSDEKDGERVDLDPMDLIKLTVEAARVPSSISASYDSSKKLLVDPHGVVAKDSLEEYKVTFTVKDQYGDVFPNAVVVLTEDNDKIDASDETGATGSKGTVEYKFKGRDFWYNKPASKAGQEPTPTAVTDVKVTAVVKVGETTYDKVKTNFVIKTEVPEVKDGALVVEGYKLAVDELKYAISEAKDPVTDTVAKAAIAVRLLSNGMNVGNDANITLLTNGSEYLKADGTFSIPSDKTEVGKIYVVVYDKNGKPLSEATKAANGVRNFGAYKSGEYINVVGGRPVVDETKVATDSYMMSYVTDESYTVKAFVISKVYTTKDASGAYVPDATKAAKFTTFTETMKVTDNNKAVTLNKQEKEDLSKEDGINNITDAIFASFKFNFGSDTLKEPTASNVKILSAKTKYNSATGELFVYHVTFAVPLNNGDDNVYYEVKEVSVNKTVKGLGANFKNVLK